MYVVVKTRRMYKARVDVYDNVPHPGEILGETWLIIQNEVCKKSPGEDGSVYFSINEILSFFKLNSIVILA